ncbi:hypothetical protein DPMN_017054 [Dreissena polymorpha]|uniref:MADF domain-containing protein n=1 Tax=Dreissena polymorpha TaxID=45954 RepID=A0A9D4S731_DREPO|nr:hypothetical protein DPMN_017054 [Dreissena polymorpha]
MLPRKRRTKAPRAAKDAQVEEQPENEPTAPFDPPLTNEEEEARGSACARKRTTPRVITNFTEEEKELIIDFLQQNQIIYSKRLTGYKDAAAKNRLWVEQATKMKRSRSELKTWYESMRTKLGKLKKAPTNFDDDDSFFWMDGRTHARTRHPCNFLLMAWA